MKQTNVCFKKVLLVVLAVLLCASAVYAEPVNDMVPDELLVVVPDGSRENPFHSLEEAVFETQLLMNGVPRTQASETEYQTVKIGITLEGSFKPSYYANNYSSLYLLTGTEAGVPLTVTVHEAQTDLVLQDAVCITLETADGKEIIGYQLMDQEIGGNYDVTFAPGSTGYACKRYTYDASAEAKYLVVTYYDDCTEQKLYIVVEEVFPSYVRGDRGDRVQEIQQKLIDLGYLNDVADGVFGGNTEKAVSEAQAAARLAATGIADNRFQHALFDGEVPQKAADAA